MKLLTGPRCGKTTKLIELSAKNGGYIVCRKNMVNIIAKQAKSMGLKIPFPLSYEEFINHRYYGRGIKEIYIDDVEELLKQISNVPIGAITISEFKSDDKNL